MIRFSPLLAVLSVLALSPTEGAAPPPSSCLYQPDTTVAIVPAPGRVVYCGLDIGSRTVKLSVVSMQPGVRTSIKDERQCKRTLGMGTMVFDSQTNRAGPLPESAQNDLADTLRDYQRICALDKGTMVAAGATQWARDATNIVDVRAHVQSATGLLFDVLSPAQEAEYSYMAAALGSPGRIVVDPGSNSFEIAWQPRDSPAVSSILVAYGYVRGSVNDLESAPSYAAGRAAYERRVRADIDAELAKLTPPMSLATLRTLVAHGKIGPEILALGQDGAVQLAARGLLRTSSGWVSTPADYEAALRRQTLQLNPLFGVMSAAALRPDEIGAFLATITPQDFAVLTTNPVRSLYGQKALIVPALIDLLFRETGAERLVMVPQEITTGHILVKLGR